MSEQKLRELIAKWREPDRINKFVGDPGAGAKYANELEAALAASEPGQDGKHLGSYHCPTCEQEISPDDIEKVNERVAALAQPALPASEPAGEQKLGGTIGLDGDTKREELVCRRHDVYYDPENKRCVICELRGRLSSMDEMSKRRTVPSDTPLREALEKIVRVASGEDQVAADDTDGMAWIDKFARAALAPEGKEQK